MSMSMSASMSTEKYVYFFAVGQAEGNAGMRELLGGKGANLAEMANLGIPVPPGFTITTEVCRYYHEHGGGYPPGLRDQVNENLRRLEQATGKGFGDPERPLLVSVRSGAAVSMPGMMDTVLNVGLTRTTLNGLIELTGNPRFAWDAYRRLVQMFGNVVLGIERERFDAVLERRKRDKGVKFDVELDAHDLRGIVEEFKQIYRECGVEFPEDPQEQLWMAIEAVFNSWNAPRAVAYREIHRITGALGTAVNVQAMVFGNLGERSATGVAFTRDPATGEKRFFGEYLPNAQGEDVVAGIRTPQPLERLREEMPEIYAELGEIFAKLERHYRDMQDVEFTIEEGKLYVLQTRTGERTAPAAIRIAVDLVDEGLITKEEALLRVKPQVLDQLLHPAFDPKERPGPVAKGIAASPGAAAGRVVFTADEAVAQAERGERVILVRKETSPDDIRGMEAAQGILTSRGGLTSHAAVVARGRGKPCIVGCEDIVIDYERKEFRVDGRVVREGDYISIDGSTGEVMLGDVPMVDSEILRVLRGELAPEESEIYRYFARFMEWADEARRLGVRANADTPQEARLARLLGAEGIGLARTEHMFFGPERLPLFQGLIISEDRAERERYLWKLAEVQKEDFKGLLREMAGLPVIIRLLDPPLHEFLPKSDEELERLAADFGIEPEKLRERVRALEEVNPMLGHRGVRLGITHPEIYAMQVEAILRAALELAEEGVEAKPEIMIPLVGDVEELKFVKREIDRVAADVLRDKKVEYKVGTMIEVPRACLVADEIAKEAEFFSFGTNDLTQMTYGFSRDDAGKFLGAYEEKGVIRESPFHTLDREGVGELMRLAVERGREARPGLSLGICGEHGGEERSVKLCHQLGLDYVSASTFRIPIARLAAAQAAVEERRAAEESRPSS